MTLPAPPSGASELFQLLRDGVPRTRAELAELAGLARSTVGLRVDELVGVGLVRPVGEAVSSGGRPAYRFAIDAGARLILAVDCGARHQRVAVLDLDANVLALEMHVRPIADGPEAVLADVAATTRTLLADLGRSESDLIALGIGLPGPVEHSTGRPLQPPIMPGWDGFDVPGWSMRELGIPALVDNDVNIMAVGERTVALPAVDDVLFIKVATGIGAGIISGGRLQRGARGTAGDLGHVRVARGAGVRCSCGKEGCLEALASGGALARVLGVATAEDVAALVASGDARAVAALTQAGRDLGEVLLSCVSLINPATVVLGSTLALPALFDGVREVLFDPGLPEAARQVGLEPALTGDRAGVIGAGVLARDEALSTDGVTALLAR
ncbi:ROK family protein [Schumannella luteola]